MTDPVSPRIPAPPAAPAADPTADDPGLKAALRQLPPERDAAALARLHARVMADWPGTAAGTAAGRAVAPGAGGLAGAAGSASASAGLAGGPVAGPGGRQRPWRLGSVLGLGLGLGAVSVALVLGLWWNRADPALDELMQPDVLSQMAAGEM